MKIKSLNLTAREADEKAKLSQTCEPINRSKLQPRNIMLPECSYLLSKGSVFSTAWISQFVCFLLVTELNVYTHALISLSVPTENKTIRQIVRRSNVFLLKSPPPPTHTHTIQLLLLILTLFLIIWASSLGVVVVFKLCSCDKDITELMRCVCVCGGGGFEKEHIRSSHNLPDRLVFCRYW